MRRLEVLKSYIAVKPPICTRSEDPGDEWGGGVTVARVINFIWGVFELSTNGFNAVLWGDTNNRFDPLKNTLSELETFIETVAPSGIPSIPKRLDSDTHLERYVFVTTTIRTYIRNLWACTWRVFDMVMYRLHELELALGRVVRYGGKGFTMGLFVETRKETGGLTPQHVEAFMDAIPKWPGEAPTYLVCDSNREWGRRMRCLGHRSPTVPEFQYEGNSAESKRRKLNNA